MKITHIILGCLVLLLVSTCKKKDEAVSPDAENAIKGNFKLKFTTKPITSDYGDSHILAVWVTKENGDFVKSLLVYAGERISYLNTWQSASDGNKTDALTGATQPSHRAYTATWNGTDKNKNEVANGTYKVWVQMTDANNSGNSFSTNFAKDAVADSATISDKTHFTNIKWTYYQ